jgi:hypothetical protein
MGIRFACPNGHKLNVKEHLAGKRGICPNCGAKFVIPADSDANGSTEAPPSITFPELRDRQPTTDVNSPSVVISITESSTLASSLPPTLDITPPVTSVGAPAVSPVFGFAAHPTASAPVPASNYAVRRARVRSTQMKIAVMLFLAAIVLAIVLVWVLQRGPAESEPEPNKTTHLAPGASQAYVADAAVLVSMPRHKQVPSL